MAKAIHLAIIDSDPLRIAGFRAFFEPQKHFLIKALSFTEVSPDLDVDVAIFPHRQGCNLAASMQRLRTLVPHLLVIVSGNVKSDDAVLDALVNGAKGYVDEAAQAPEFVRAIQVVNQGLIWASRRVIAQFVDRYGQGGTAVPGERFTIRQREVLRMLVAGRSNKEIAEPLGIEERTVKAHVAGLMRKIGVNNRIALSVHAVRHALVR